ncbi:50S ribosomal protein L3 [Blattabacterium cuenoti]|uniref:50S ribosomal protein L3 n=1 Tax=Blattabacterium cuenoti TaxID=1653831 RepID=UPI00163C00D6|nr:50S ribosomal protein L3 [Blattabacterium cuenoti]
MIGLIGKNIGMTSIYLHTNEYIACTIVKTTPCYIIQVKTIEKDGYQSFQLGLDEKKIKKVNKPLLGHFKKCGLSPKKKLLEFRIERNKLIYNQNIGDIVDIGIFSIGELIDVRGISKGKGFQGVVKRHNFSGVGERSHGQHNRLRSPGSIGAGSDPSRVFKGTKMAGKMGKKNVTIKNIEILKIDFNQHLLILKGSVPGNKGSYLMIKKKQ